MLLTTLLTDHRFNNPIAAEANRLAAILIAGLRTYVIGKLILDAFSIAAAIITGGASTAASLAHRQGANLLINRAINEAINDLTGA